MSVRKLIWCLLPALALAGETTDGPAGVAPESGSFSDRLLRLVPRVSTGPAFQPQGSLSWRTTLTNPAGEDPRTGLGAGDERLGLHTGRLLAGARGLSADHRLGWSVLLGGTLAQNTRYEQRIYTPEARLDLAWRVHDRLGLRLGSRHGWREANRFLADSLRLRDWVTVLGLTCTNEYLGELDLTGGNRRAYRDGDPEDTRFLSGTLRGTLPGGLRLHAFGETLGYGLQDSLDFDLSRNQAGFNLSGPLPWQGRQQGELVRRWREGRVQWLVNERFSVRPLPGHLVEARFGTDWSEWQQQDLFRRHYLASWNWSPAGVWGLRLLGEGSWLRLDHQDVDHERAVLAGPWLRSRPLESHAGGTTALAPLAGLDLQASFDGGLKQSVRWGDGIDLRFRETLGLPLRPWPVYSLMLQQDLTSEWLLLQDGDFFEQQGTPLATETPHELASRLALSAESGPWLGSRLRLGHRHSWDRHLGSEILFPLDSLRNTLQHEVWARHSHRGQQFRLSLAHIRHTQARPGHEIEYRCALGWLAHSGRSLSGGGDLIWRPGRRAIDERLWLRLHGDWHWRQLAASLQADFNGPSDDLGRRDTRLWFQLSRKLW